MNKKGLIYLLIIGISIANFLSAMKGVDRDKIKTLAAKRMAHSLIDVEEFEKLSLPPDPQGRVAQSLDIAVEELENLLLNPNEQEIYSIVDKQYSNDWTSLMRIATGKFLCKEYAEGLYLSSECQDKKYRDKLLDIYLKIATLLVENGADISAKNSDGESALMIAFNSKNRPMIDFLLKLSLRKEDISSMAQEQNRNGWTLLMYIAKGNFVCEKDVEDPHLKCQLPDIYLTIAKLLIEDGDAGINAQNNNGRTALMIALKGMNSQLIELLLKQEDIARGVQDDNGFTSLHYAIKLGYDDVACKLIEKGASPNIKTKGTSYLKGRRGYSDVSHNYEETPLMFAAKRNSWNVVQCLLKAKANPFLTNSVGQTAADLATNYTVKEEIAKIMEQQLIKKMDKKREATRLAKAKLMQEQKMAERLKQALEPVDYRKQLREKEEARVEEQVREQAEIEKRQIAQQREKEEKLRVEEQVREQAEIEKRRIAQQREKEKKLSEKSKQQKTPQQQGIVEELLTNVGNVWSRFLNYWKKAVD